MFTTLQSSSVRDYLAIANDVSTQLAADAVSQDIEAGIPSLEVNAIKESGLILLTVPREYGGAGATWPQAYKVVQTLARASGSVGQIYANHISLVAVAEAIGRAGQAEHFYRLTARHNLFWANALNARDARLKIAPTPDGFRVNGVKSFGTGVAAADMNVIAAVQDGSPMPVVFVIPRDRAGLTYNHDWHNMGQRRTASGSYSFDNLWVSPEEVLGPPPNLESIFPTLIFLVSQMGKVYTYLGIAEGALQAAKDYTTTQTRPWQNSGVDSASQDPYILHHYGEFWAELQAAIALADRAAEQLQAGWERNVDLTFEERGEIAIAAAAAKSMAIKAGLHITSSMFEVMGARATASRFGSDRFWRDLRTFSLHDPIAYKFRDIGNWFLSGEYPIPSQYS